jgi:hypothetical protein
MIGRDYYQETVDMLSEALGEAAQHQKRLVAAKSDIERLDAIEKLIAYSGLLTAVGTWAMATIRWPQLPAAIPTPTSPRNR